MTIRKGDGIIAHKFRQRTNVLITQVRGWRHAQRQPKCANCWCAELFSATAVDTWWTRCGIALHLVARRQQWRWKREALVMMVINTVLCCSQCQAETAHTLVYLGPYLHEATCHACQTMFARDLATLRRLYVHDLPGRAFHFFLRNVVFAREHPSDFLTHLPRKVILKPLEFSSELYRLFSQ